MALMALLVVVTASRGQVKANTSQLMGVYVYACSLDSCASCTTNFLLLHTSIHQQL